MAEQKTHVTQDIPQLHHLPASLLPRANHAPQTGEKARLLLMGLETSLRDKHWFLNLGRAVFCAKACDPVHCTASCRSSRPIFGVAIADSPRIRQKNWYNIFLSHKKNLPVLPILDCKDPLPELNILLNPATNKHTFQGFLALSYNCLPQMPDKD